MTPEPVDPYRVKNAAANDRGAKATAAAQKRKQELMAQGIPEAEAHLAASQVYQEFVDGGSGDGRDDPPPQQPASDPRAAPQSQSVQFNNTQNVREQAQNNRARVAGRADVLDQQDQDQIADQTGRRTRTGNYLDDLYRGDAEGWGGFNDAERNDIMGREGLAGLQQTGEERQANYLSDDEEAGARGDPASQERFLNPGQMDQDLRVSQGRQDQAVDDLDQGLRKAVDSGQLRQSETYRGNSRNILDRNRGGFDTTLDAVGSNVRGAIDPGAVATSDQFLDDYQMSPEEQQDIVTGAGISAGTGYRAVTGELQRRATAAGVSPMGVGAYRARMEREGAAASGDAQTLARIRASEAAAGRKMSGEELRTQGGRYLTDVQSDTEMGLGREALQGQQVQGQQDLAQENTMEQNRQGAEQFLTGADLDVAQTSGRARLANATTSTGQGQQQRQFSATTGTGIAQAQDRDAAARNATIATNRQGAEQYNQGQRYGRGMDANNATSTRATQIGNARLGQQSEGRNYYQGQNTQANQNQENARNRQQQTFSTTTGGMNDSTRTSMQADQAPKTWEKIASVGIGALGAVTGGGGVLPRPKPAADGGVVTEPGVYLLGEEGPEQVVPLSYRASARSRPSAAVPQPRRRSFYGEAAA